LSFFPQRGYRIKPTNNKHEIARLLSQRPNQAWGPVPPTSPCRINTKNTKSKHSIFNSNKRYIKVSTKVMVGCDYPLAPHGVLRLPTCPTRASADDWDVYYERILVVYPCLKKCCNVAGISRFWKSKIEIEHRHVYKLAEHLTSEEEEEEVVVELMEEEESV